MHQLQLIISTIIKVNLNTVRIHIKVNKILLNIALHVKYISVHTMTKLHGSALLLFLLFLSLLQWGWNPPFKGHVQSVLHDLML